MEQTEKSFGGVRLLVAAASFVIVVAGLKAAKSFLLPFSFALILAILATAAVSWLKKKKVPGFLAIIIVILTAVLGLFGTASILGNSVAAFTASVPAYKQRFAELIMPLRDQFESLGLEPTYKMLRSSLEPGSLLDIVGITLKSFVSLFSAGILVLVIMAFIMAEMADLREKLHTALGDSIDTDRMEDIGTDIQRYLGIKTITSIVTGLLVGIWVTVMGVDFPVLWGLIAFLFNYVPMIGSIIAAIPAVLLAILQFGLDGALGLAVGYCVINVGVSNLLEPVLMGRRLGLSPLVVFLSLVFWGYVWGPAGMLLSVPLTMVVKIFLEHTEDFRWVAVLMEKKARKPTQ